MGLSRELESRLQRVLDQGLVDEAAAIADSTLAAAVADSSTAPHVRKSLEVLSKSLWTIRALDLPRRAILDRAREASGTLDTLLSSNNPARAESLQLQVVHLHEEVLGRLDPWTSGALNRLGCVYMRLEKPRKAEEAFRRASAVAAMGFGEDHPVTALYTENIAWALLTAGDNAEAEGPLLRASRIYDHLVEQGYEDRIRTMVWWQLAMVAADRGDFAAARDLWNRVRAARGEQHPTPSVEEGLLYRKQAIILAMQGDTPAVEAAYRRMLENYEASLGKENPRIATVLWLLGTTLWVQGEPGRGEPYLRDALRVRLAGNSTDTGLAAVEEDLAGCLRDQGKFAEADSLYRESLRIREATQGPNDPDVARTLTYRGFLLQAMGHPDKALRLHRRAAEIRRRNRPAGARAHPEEVESMVAIGACLGSLGRWEEAEARLVECAAAFRLMEGQGEHVIGVPSIPLPSPFGWLAAARLALGHPNEAWAAADQDLARSMSARMPPVSSMRTAGRQHAKLDSLRRRILLLEEEAELNSLAPLLTREMSRRALETAQHEWDTLRARIATRPELGEATFPLARVQRALDGHTAIVGWVEVSEGPFRGRTWGYLIRSVGAVEWVSLEPPTDSLQTGAVALREALEDVAGPLQTWPPPEADFLRRARLDPLLSRLDGITKLVVIPSGAVLGLPLEALPLPSGAMLGDAYDVMYTTSASVYAALSERAPTRAIRSLLVGDPTIVEDEATPESASLPRGGSATGGTTDATDPGKSRESSGSPDPPSIAFERGVYWRALVGAPESNHILPRLPGARREIESIAQLLPSPIVLLDSLASEKEIRKLEERGEMGSFRFIHVATHALVDDARPELSALVLAQDPQPRTTTVAGARINDGLLRAREIAARWKLDADLVALSACRTGLGMPTGGRRYFGFATASLPQVNEGYVGLADSFFAAGARNLILSLWGVDDQATMMLMKRFYENYSDERTGLRIGKSGRLPPARALSEARSWLRGHRDVEGKAIYAHPHYWAAFVLVGGAK
jgi:CHAT domain-containing protein/tetratricopeptide (TPR) repeat protein